MKCPTIAFMLLAGMGLTIPAAALDDSKSRLPVLGPSVNWIVTTMEADPLLCATASNCVTAKPAVLTAANNTCRSMAAAPAVPPMPSGYEQSP